ncbi:hypothetical protein [Catellatospora tritici]|uniref:hypothetical protein n=1 Tax=Catellatospora tritici TaxID=2851566 RepID=UPI001C2DD3B0|nr:hypothetical protein [Catellatospora tritici]MBV1854632.1 hypothetical protein [Catellatospora tritici]
MSVAADQLERRYRLLLRAYPRWWRAARGPELLATLLDTAPPGARRPSLADTTDLLRNGVRCRLGLSTDAGLDEGLGAAAPVALALAAGLSAFLWWRVEPSPLGGGTPGAHGTLGPLAYLAWLVALGVTILAPARTARAAIGGAIGATLALPPLATLTAPDRPPLWVLGALLCFGLLSLPIAGRLDRPGGGELRVGLALGAVAVAAGADAVARAWPGPVSAAHSYYQPTIAQVGVVVAATVAVLALLSLPRHRVPWRQPHAHAHAPGPEDGRLRPRPATGTPIGAPDGAARGRAVAGTGAQARGRLWATLLIGLPGAWLGPVDTGTWRAAGELPRFGRLAEVLLGSCVVLLCMAELRRRRAGRGGGPWLPPGAAGAALIGYAVGLATFAGLLGAVTGHVLATAVTCAGVGAVLAGTAAGRRWWPVAGTAGAVTVLAAYAVGVYSNDWSGSGWQLGRTTGLAATLAVVPLAAAAHAVWAHRDTLPRTAALIGGGGAVAWLAWLTLPDLPAWGPVPLVLLAGAAALAGLRRIPAWSGRR